MKTVIVVAIARNNIIGREGDLPWHHPRDLRHFKKTTMGHPIVAGRKTFESFPRGPLPGRLNIVLTRNPEYRAPAGVLLCPSLEAAREYCEREGAEKMFIVGGGEIYRLALPVTDEMIVTHIPDEVEGDTTFPVWGREEWEVVDSRAEAGLGFVSYRRKG